MNVFRRYLCCCILLLISGQSTCHAVATYLQPETVYLGDISELVIEYENTIPSLYALDTSVLESDFEVVDKKSRIIRLTDSDQVIHRMQWRLQLLPRRSGKLSVPKLYFGDSSTQPLTLEVKPVPPSLQSSQQVFVEMVADSLNPYVGQQIQIDMRLHHNTPLSDGRLLEAEISGALIHRQIEERSYRVTRNGQNFQVRDRGIALFPESAGVLRLSPANFRGTIQSSTEATQTGIALAPRKVFRHSNPLTLQVRSPPAEFSGRFWLPATHLEISQAWADPDSALTTGDSLSGTLTIITHGLPAESLPLDLMVRESENYRVYADQAELSNHFDGRQMVGRLDQRFAVIASRAGKIALPAITLQWWDVANDVEKQARLEGKIISVATAKAEAAQTRGDSGITGRLLTMTGIDAWPPLLFMLAIAVIVAIRLLYPRIVDMLEPPIRRWRLNRRVKLSCLSNDTINARRALLDWGRAHCNGHGISGLFQIDQQIACGELSMQLRRLDEALYARPETEWDGRALWRQVDALNRRGRLKKQTTGDALPGLYPL